MLDEQLLHQQTRMTDVGELSSMPVTEVLPTMEDDVSTTEGTVRPVDNSTDDAMIANASIAEGDPSVVPAGSGKWNIPIVACS